MSLLILVFFRNLTNFFLASFTFLENQSVREKPYPDEERVKGDPARDLATIHHLCEANLQELQRVAKSQVRIWQLCPRRCCF